MLKKYITLFFALSLALPAIEPAELNSEAVDWTRVKMEGGKLSLPNVFSVTLPATLKWKAIISGVGPTGSPFHMWAVDTSGEPRKILLVIFDVDISKVPGAERESFITTFVKAFRRTGIAAMEKKGYLTKKFDITPYPAGGDQSVKAFSDFEKDGLHLYNITYTFCMKRFYMLGYEGDESQAPQWFLDTLTHFEKS